MNKNRRIKLFEEFTPNDSPSRDHDRTTQPKVVKGKSKDDREFEVKKDGDRLLIVGLRVDAEDAHTDKTHSSAEGKVWKPEHYDAFDWLEYGLRAKKPLLFGKSNFKKDLAGLAKFCSALKVEKFEVNKEDEKKGQNWNDFATWDVTLKGSEQDIENVYDMLEAISKFDY